MINNSVVIQVPMNFTIEGVYTYSLKDIQNQAPSNLEFIAFRPPVEGEIYLDPSVKLVGHIRGEPYPLSRMVGMDDMSLHPRLIVRVPLTPAKWLMEEVPFTILHPGTQLSADYMLISPRESRCPRIPHDILVTNPRGLRLYKVTRA